MPVYDLHTADCIITDLADLPTVPCSYSTVLDLYGNARYYVWMDR